MLFEMAVVAIIRSRLNSYSFEVFAHRAPKNIST